MHCALFEERASNLVWRKLFFFLCPYLETFMNIHPPVHSAKLLAKMVPENIKINPLPEWWNAKFTYIPDYSLYHSRHILTNSWIPIRPFTMIVLTDAPPPLYERPWNSLARLGNSLCDYSFVVSDILWKLHESSLTRFFFHNIADKHGFTI